MIITILKLFLFCLIAVQCNLLYSKIVINELMTAPVDGEPEWIELFNAGTAAVVMFDYTISDLVSVKNMPEFELKQGCYAILVKDTNLLKSYREIPNSSVLVQCTIPSLNNTFDAVILKAPDGRIIDSVYYDMNWGEKGVSLERADCNAPAVNQDNWGKSLEQCGATAGEMNSIAIINYDILCKSISLNGSYENLSISVRDEGKTKSNSFNFTLAVDLNKNGIVDIDEIVLEIENLIIAERDTVIEISMESLKKVVPKNSEYSVLGAVYSATDQRRLNDTARSRIYFRIETPVVRINEIMYDVSTGNVEYIELWNGGKDTLLLDGFLIWDAAGSLTKGNIKILSDKCKIAPDNYGVVTWDSTFFNKYSDLCGSDKVHFYKSSFNLNQSSDLIVLADLNGKVYDSLTYFNTWHNESVKETKNRSLEKISPGLLSNLPESWSSCTEIGGGSPGRKNSLTGLISSSGSLAINPNPFAPSSGGQDANAVISYELTFIRAKISAGVYDKSGYRVNQLANNRYSGAVGSLVWDGKNSEGYIVQAGQYILILEASDNDSGNVYQNKSLIVVGK